MHGLAARVKGPPLRVDVSIFLSCSTSLVIPTGVGGRALRCLWQDHPPERIHAVLLQHAGGGLETAQDSARNGLLCLALLMPRVAAHPGKKHVVTPCTWRHCATWACLTPCFLCPLHLPSSGNGHAGGPCGGPGGAAQRAHRVRCHHVTPHSTAAATATCSKRLPKGTCLAACPIAATQTGLAGSVIAPSFGSRPFAPFLSAPCSNNTLGKRLRAAEQQLEKTCDVDEGEVPGTSWLIP